MFREILDAKLVTEVSIPTQQNNQPLQILLQKKQMQKYFLLCEDTFH